MNTVLTRSCPSQIFEPPHFKGFTGYLHVIILWILVVSRNITLWIHF